MLSLVVIISCLEITVLFVGGQISLVDEMVSFAIWVVDVT